jgi:alkanesulfonate monooxygenase SsuD/methylene tetrahydromethanopterin reductase-like flavin-dependent oxidoreductase (luciferase family)
MEFGLFSESGHRHNSVAAETFNEDLAEVVLADQLGMREAWIAEPNHVRANTVTHSSLLMCRAAALTERIRFGNGIRQLPLHHPVDLVQEANMCDQVTHGRYIFGYGGTHLASHEQLHMRGIDVARDETRSMVYESIDFILKCWTSPEPFDYEGRYWRGTGIHVLPRPFQRPHPPIAAACTGSAETLDLAARHGFIPLLGRGNDLAQDIRRSGDIYVGASEAAGRAPSRREFRVARVVYVGETDEKAKDDVRHGLSRLLEERKVEGPYLLKHVPPGGTLDDLTFEYMLDRGLYWVGDPETVYKLIEDYYVASGGFGVLLIFAGLPIAPPGKLARSMRLLMEHVAPRLAHLDPDLAPAALSG